MSKRRVAAAIFLLSAGGLLHARGRPLQGTDPRASVDGAAYPESPDGLKRQVQDLLDALTSEDTDRWSALTSSLTIPDHSAWFAKTFGASEGARLEAKYADVLPRVPAKLRQRFNYALDGQMSDVTAAVLQKPAANTGEPLDRAIFEAMASPVTIYRAKGIGPVFTGVNAGPMGRFPTYLGDFVFVDGAFRYIDLEVFEALSTAPQPRIRQGEKVTAASILYQPAPEYPREVRAKRIEGDVVLHVIIDKNGSIKNMELLSGDPALTQAAMDAVKKWKYKPTLLNGQPVEIDSRVTVTFQFNR